MGRLEIYKDKCLWCGATKEDWTQWTSPWVNDGIKTITYRCKCGKYFMTEEDVGGTMDFYL